MRTIALLTLSLLGAGCGAASPCQPATAAGEPYCAMVCGPNPERASHGCPGELSYRTELDGAAVCRAEEGPLPEAICEQLPNGCDAPPRVGPPTGPRCTPDNPLCLPRPYEGCHAFAVDGPRRPSELGTSAGACEHDGECMISGCGNDCVRWDQTGAGTCEGYLPERPTFCGCVSGACQWFTQ